MPAQQGCLGRWQRYLIWRAAPIPSDLLQFLKKMLLSEMPCLVTCVILSPVSVRHTGRNTVTICVFWPGHSVVNLTSAPAVSEMTHLFTPPCSLWGEFCGEELVGTVLDTAPPHSSLHHCHQINDGWWVFNTNTDVHYCNKSILSTAYFCHLWLFIEKGWMFTSKFWHLDKQRPMNPLFKV